MNKIKNLATTLTKLVGPKTKIFFGLYFATSCVSSLLFGSYFYVLTGKRKNQSDLSLFVECYVMGFLFFPTIVSLMCFDNYVLSGYMGNKLNKIILSSIK